MITGGTSIYCFLAVISYLQLDGHHFPLKKNAFDGNLSLPKSPMILPEKLNQLCVRPHFHDDEILTPHRLQKLIDNGQKRILNKIKRETGSRSKRHEPVEDNFGESFYKLPVR